MKKIVSLILICLIVLNISAQVSGQTRITSSVKCPAYGYVWGTAADSLINGDTLTASIRVYADTEQKIQAWLYNDKVSGTVSDTFYVWGSPDGTTKAIALDTIFNSNVSDGFVAFSNPVWSNFSYPYLIFWNINRSGGAANKAIKRIDLLFRNK